ncbi:MAG: fumarylacetoacetate hydrolase family protein [Parvularculaceae bacterium]
MTASEFVLFDIPSAPCVPVAGEAGRYPVRRIFCIGKNYADHAREMGGEPDKSYPIYFTKPASAIALSGATIPYPPRTSDFHYEMEMVIALGKSVFNASPADAAAAIYGYGCGLDMTRRDLQAQAKTRGAPWDTAKAFENSAIIGALTKASDVGPIGAQRIFLQVNGETRQDAHLRDMLFSCEEIIADLSSYYHLAPGDLIFTGTPAGVGAVNVGDELAGGIDGLAPISLAIGAPD